MSDEFYILEMARYKAWLQIGQMYAPGDPVDLDEPKEAWHAGRRFVNSCESQIGLEDTSIMIDARHTDYLCSLPSDWALRFLYPLVRTAEYKAFVSLMSVSTVNDFAVKLAYGLMTCARLDLSLEDLDVKSRSAPGKNTLCTYLDFRYNGAEAFVVAYRSGVTAGRFRRGEDTYGSLRLIRLGYWERKKALEF